ncbi:hypothetical protein GCM10007870_19780 [Gluconobacter kondonii]|uniref:Uncharacterized protein n=1 Tax=Gluconobacter kondonii TaxID=941463 RepID=A0ABQ5WSQ0_9PROT|nr:hypothetical protein AA3266_2121 [Gluconobacter kondonii NBRC 3266]GLQ66394.1 hypothetical protein GCM10007870_19780 [Gluconobacter kondonii]
MPVSLPTHSTEPEKKGVLRYRWPAKKHTRYATLRLFQNPSFLNVFAAGYPVWFHPHPIVTVCAAPVAELRQVFGTGCLILPYGVRDDRCRCPDMPVGFLGEMLHELQS